MTITQQRESINKSADRATKAFTDLCACQKILVNLDRVNKLLIGASARLIERMGKIHSA